VLVGEFGETLLIDCGLAKRVDGDVDASPLIVGGAGDLTIAGDVLRAWTPGAPSRVLYRHEGPVWGLAVSPDGALIASSASDRTIRIARADGSIVQLIRGHTDDVSFVAFEPAGDAVYSSSMDGTILRWPLDLDREPPRTRAALAAHVADLTSVEVE
jgi:WD40 repeat protein